MESKQIDNNESLLWFWATWECAQFAILARLRTPLGKAPETFVAIESVIKAFAVESQNLDALEDSPEKKDSARSTIDLFLIFLVTSEVQNVCTNY